MPVRISARADVSAIGQSPTRALTVSSDEAKEWRIRDDRITKLKTVHLQLPATTEQLAALEIGTVVYLTGRIYTAREGVYKKRGGGRRRAAGRRPRSWAPPTSTARRPPPSIPTAAPRSAP